MASPLRRMTLIALLSATTAIVPAFAQDAPPPAQPADEGGAPVLTDQGQDAQLPTAEALFERHIEAIGGREKVFGLKNRRITGVFEGGPFKFAARLTSWLEAPNKLRSKISEPAGRTIELGYDGEQAWRRIDNGPVVILDGEAADTLRDAADFFGAANYKNRYASVKSIGTGELMSRSVYIVQATWPSGSKELVLFDRNTGRYVGVQFKVTVKSGEQLEILTLVDKYQEFGGVEYPMRITQMTLEGKIQATYDYRDIRVDVDDGFDNYAPPTDAAASAGTPPEG